MPNNDQYTRIMKNHGPPPSYEIALAMKNPIPAIKCRICRNRVRFSCSCDAHSLQPGQECGTDKPDNMMSQTNQFLDIRDFAQHQNMCCCGCTSDCANHNQSNVVAKACQLCDENILSKKKYLNDQDLQNGNSFEGHCQCYDKSNNDLCARDVDLANRKLDAVNGNDMNDNIPSTSGDINYFRKTDCNSNYEGNDDDIDDEDTDFDSLNKNGLIRVNMSQIIDPTGLPTYEAALKLESSGYV